MEKFGTGIGKMKKIMKEYGLPVPKFAEEGDFFVVRFYGPAEKILDLVPSIPKEKQLDLRELGLNNRQIEALRVMVNEGQRITTIKYCQLFKVSRNTAYLDLNDLTQKELIIAKGKGRSLYYIAK
jgi:predicted HTH transcriptional regulator